MRLLLSAYACEPNEGSEPAVGWQWAMETARLGHEVWVLTRANNRENIETELAKQPPIINLHFLYYDLPSWARWWKKGNRGIHLYYLLWQWGAYLLAKRIHEAERFDQVHHVTFVNVRQPSFMGNLGIPFIFGPAAGGEKAPWPLRRGYGWRGWVRDGLRDLANFLTRLDPFTRQTFKQAKKIFVTSEQTLSLLPRKYRQKASVQLAIGLNSEELTNLVEPRTSSPDKNGCFKVLYVGNLLYLKGMHLGLPAFAHTLKKFSNFRLTMVGKGPDKQRWQTLADDLGIGERIDWMDPVDRRELPALYASHDVFLFPSLHDSGGMVVLEALAHGLPVVCLDLGGPGKIVDETCGLKVETKGLNKERTIDALADRMVHLAGDSALFSRLSIGAPRRAKEFGWPALVGRFYSEAGAK